MGNRLAGSGGWYSSPWLSMCYNNCLMHHDAEAYELAHQQTLEPEPPVGSSVLADIQCVYEPPQQ